MPDFRKVFNNLHFVLTHHKFKSQFENGHDVKTNKV